MINDRMVQKVKQFEANGCVGCCLLNNGICLKKYHNDCYIKNIYVEIKQTKEDMEEKNESAEEISIRIANEFEEKLEKHFKEYMDKIDTSNLKPFDIQKAREGEPVYTRDGRKARIVCFDRIDAKPILALVPSTDGKGEDVFDYFVSGKRIANALESDLDLMMLPEKKVGWAKIRKDINLYDTKEEADRKMIGNDEYVTAKVCWEE